MAPTHQGADVTERTPAPDDVAGPTLPDTLFAPLRDEPPPDLDHLGLDLIEQFDELLAKARAGRDVRMPEDTHAVLRKLAEVARLAGDLERAAKSLRSKVESTYGEELLEAVGPFDSTDPGRPLRGMDVALPDGGVLTISPAFTTTHFVDMDQVVWVTAEAEATQRDRLGDPVCTDERGATREQVVQFATQVVNKVLTDIVQATKPKVTGIDALSVMLGHWGNDHLASVLNAATDPDRDVTQFKAISFERKAPSKTGPARVTRRRRRSAA